MKLTDGKRTVSITMREWQGNSYAPDFSNDFFDAGCLPWDDEYDLYTVPDVEYCIDVATDWKEDDYQIVVIKDVRFEATMQRGEGDMFTVGIFDSPEQAQQAIDRDREHLTPAERERAVYRIYDHVEG